MAFESKRKVDIDEAPKKEETPDHQCCNKLSELMKHELDANKALKHGRASWLKNSAIDHVLQTYYHTGKLQIAVKELLMLREAEAHSRRITLQEEAVVEFAADVANHAMMVLDVLDLLGIPRPPKKEKVESYSTFS
jgi:hypothetical protein